MALLRTVGAVGAVVLAIGLAGACSSGDTAEKPGSSDAAMDGTFDVVYADGQRKETWVSRSLCRDDGCVAEVSVRDAASPAAAELGTRTFDLVDGRWQTVLTGPGRCQAPEGEVDVDNWSVISLEPQPDGTFDGFFRFASAPRLCTGSQTVKVTKAAVTVDEITALDPAAASPLKKSPAAALHGRYRYTQSADGEVYPPGDYEGATYCLRTGDGCLTYMARPGTDYLLVMMFGAGVWRLNAPTSDAECTGGAGNAKMEAYDEFPLPDPAQDPITLLVGKTNQTYIGDCPGDAQLDVKLERLGD